MYNKICRKYLYTIKYKNIYIKYLYLYIIKNIRKYLYFLHILYILFLGSSGAFVSTFRNAMLINFKALLHFFSNSVYNFIDKIILYINHMQKGGISCMCLFFLLLSCHL